MFIAEIRRSAKGFLKAPKRQGPNSNLFMPETRVENIATYFTTWPKRRSAYLAFGGAARAQSTAALPALALKPPCGALEEWGGRPALDPLRLYPEPALARSQEQHAAPKPRPKVGVATLQAMRERGEAIAMVTAYDCPSARLADGAGVDAVLVGDSVGMVVLGQKDTTSVTMDEMVHHCRAASRGVESAMVIGDLPFGSCLTAADAARNSVRLLKEGRVDAVKIEGGRRAVPMVRAAVDAGVAVVGHIGLTPQSHAALGGYKVQGRTAAAAAELLLDAHALQEAGCFAVVLEMVPAPVAAEISARLRVPTIGIGAGGGTGGQVQVWHDLLGLYDEFVPKFSRQFLQLGAPIGDALRAYTDEVKARNFPAPSHSFGIADAEKEAFLRWCRPDEPNGHGTNGHAGTNGHHTANGHHRNGANGHANGHAASPMPPPPSAAAAAPAVDAASAVLGVGGGPTVVTSIAEWRALQKAGALGPSVGLVPTMGALHDGHLSLVELARRDHATVAVSIFVNPRQFAAHEDFGTYPRTLDADVAALHATGGVDFVFAPDGEEMYPKGSDHGGLLRPYIDLEGVDGVGEGARRPGFFRGVATVVAKLLNIVRPDALYLGQKDGLQCVVIQRLIDDLNFDTSLVVGPTVREADGLAMSSRNVYLTPAERAAAPATYAALRALAASRAGGEASPAALRAAAAAVIDREPLMELEYVSVASTTDGQELETLPPLGGGGGGGDAFASIALKIGKTRLIDNVLL